MSDPLDFLGDGGFRAGLAVGLSLSVVAAVVSRRGWPAAGAPGQGRPAAVGTWAAGAAVAVMAAGSGVPLGLPVGLALLAGAARAHRRAPWPVAWGLAGAAAFVLGWQAGGPAVTWIQLLVAATALAGGAALADVDARWDGSGAVPVLLAVTVLGIYFTVPDTREALVVLGAALPLAVAAWPLRLVRLGAAGAAAVAGLLAWVVAFDGHGRQSSVVGGVACLGLLALEPAVRRLSPGRPSPLEAAPRGWLRVPAVAAAHLAFVIVASRVAGLRSPAPYRPGGPGARGGVAEAVAIVAALVVAAAGLCLLAQRWAGRRRGGVA